MLTAVRFLFYVLSLSLVDAPLDAAEVRSFPDFTTIIESQTARLAAVASDREAKQFVASHLAPALALPAEMEARETATDLEGALLRLATEMSVWTLAQALEEAAEAGEASRVVVLLRERERQMAWLISGSDRTHLRRAAELAATMTAPASSPDPLLTAQLVAAALRAKADAERRIRAAWIPLDQWRERRGLMRLCGTWLWTVHNHKHHREQKASMIFLPPDAPPSHIPRPAKAVVLGDSVYLRWEFQGGYQEDSLLFAAEGQRLEGTFVNSTGAWGSITGKRTGACPAGKER
jgi:hypothetical protein